MTNDHPAPVETDEAVHEGASSGRRAALKAIALGGAGAAVGAVAFSSRNASAADGDPVNAGENVTAQSPTSIEYDGAAFPNDGPSAFSVFVDAPNATDGNDVFPAAVGGYGKDTVLNGVHGSTLVGPGFGVVAANLADEAADTDPAPKALALVSENGSQVLFVASGVSGPTAGTHVPGEMYVDADGTLWFSVPTATAGEVAWVRLAGASSATAASEFYAIDPARAYDSRKTGYAVSGPLARNTSREIDVSDAHDRDSATVTVADVVPAGARAVLVNVTVSSPTDKNFISVTAGNVTTTATSLQNWDLGVTQIANSITVPLSFDRTIRVYMGDQAGSADIIVDVFGYYM